jgi:HlyD family secretion protein
VEGTIGEFEERRVAAEDQLKRIELRAPQSGIVHELAVHTADAVIAPGEVVMLIVPAADKLEAEIKIAPQDIDQLSIGQEVNLRFSAFNQRTTPEVAGTLERIGADLTREVQTGLSYYTVRVAVASDEVKKLGAVKLLPGMPVEAFVKTEDRTALSYLVKPLEDQIKRAFREE